MHLHGRQYVQSPAPRDFLQRRAVLLGQESPTVEEHQATLHGRYLVNSFGDDSPVVGGSQTMPSTAIIREDPNVRASNLADDSAGAGIFDRPGSATVHREMGVFADNPALPGFIARQLPFVVSNEVSDAPAGAAVVEVPGGGFWAVERFGNTVPYPGRAAPRPPFAAGTGPSSTFNPYVMQTQDPNYPYPFAEPAPSFEDTSGTFLPGYGSTAPVASAAPEEKPLGFWTYALVGAMVGVAGAMVVHATKIKKGALR